MLNALGLQLLGRSDLRLKAGDVVPQRGAELFGIGFDQPGARAQALLQSFATGVQDYFQATGFQTSHQFT